MKRRSFIQLFGSAVLSAQIAFLAPKTWELKKPRKVRNYIQEAVEEAMVYFESELAKNIYTESYDTKPFIGLGSLQSLTRLR